MLNDASIPARQMLSSHLDAIQRTIQKLKQRATCNFPEPANLEGLDIEGLRELRTSDGEPLLLDASDPKRRLVFGTGTTLGCLEECEIIAADATFKVL